MLEADVLSSSLKVFFRSIILFDTVETPRFVLTISFVCSATMQSCSFSMVFPSARNGLSLTICQLLKTSSA